MNNKNHIVIIFRASNRITPKYLGLLDEADIIFGLGSPPPTACHKYQHLYNKDFFFEAADLYSTHINNELLQLSQKTNIDEISLLNYFEPHPDQFQFIFFLVKVIGKHYHGSKISLLTSDRRVSILHKRSHYLNLENMEVIYSFDFEKKEFWGPSILVMTNKILFTIFNLFYLFLNVSLDLLFKILNPTQPPLITDAIFLSANFKYWSTQGAGQPIDFYYAAPFKNLLTNFKWRLNCWTFTPSMNRNFTKNSIIYFCSIKTILRKLPTAIRLFFNALRFTDPHWLLNDHALLQKILNKLLLTDVLIAAKPKLLIYYDEVYSFGRIISQVANKISIDSYGFQHALNTYSHITYKNLRLFPKLPSLFPKFIYVYGPYTKKLYVDYGYPDDKLITIGCDRIPAIPRITYPKINTATKNMQLLYLGLPNDFFETFYNQKSHYEFRKITYRYHPGFLNEFNQKEFKLKYPDIFIIDSRNTSLDENIAESDCVLSLPTTALLNAISQSKVSICWLPCRMVDYLDFKRWGAQVVETLDTVDWTLKANPQYLQQELESQTDISTILESRYGSKSQR